MALLETLERSFLSHLVATPKGRAHLLNQVADAESNGESKVFDSALALVDDEAIRKLIARHARDEVEHAKMFEDRRDAQGFDVGAAPEHLRLIVRLDKKLGGFFERGVRTRRDVMDAYLMLQVVEERACTQFPKFADAFRATDPVTARVFDEVGKDEERHLKYCRAIAKQYAPSHAIHMLTLAEMRANEAECFVENTRAGFEWVLDGGYTDLSPIERTGWRSLGRLGRIFETPRTTPFATLAAA